MNLKLFLQVIWARLWIILLILIGTVATAAWVTIRTPPSYTAAASLVIDYQSKGPFDQVNIARQLASSYLATQVDIIRSRSVALRAVDSLAPESKAAAIAAFLSPDVDPHADNVVRPLLANELLDNLVVRTSGESQVVNLEFTSPDNKLSAAIANAFADAYIDISLELQVEPAKRNAQWFEGQLKELRASHEEKQRQLTDKMGQVNVDERLDVESRRLQELSTALVEAQSNTYDVESRQLGKQHPEYQRAIDRERSVRESLNRQKLKVQEIQRQRDELSLLAREVENSRNMYDQALQQFNQSTMQSQFTGTNIAILSKAAMSNEPSSPGLLTNVILAVLLGLVLGFAAAFVLEAVDRRVRTPEDLSEGLRVRTLGKL